MEYANILYEIKEQTAWITINRPDRLNALNSSTLEEIAGALESARADGTIRCVAITGSGTKAFIAGADIAELASLTGPGSYGYTRAGQAIINRIEEFPKPVIAAINGYALGGGFELALAAHIRFASENAQMGLPEINLAIMPGWGGTQRLPRLIGKGRALELLLSAQRISAEEAYRLGIVNRVFKQEELIPEVQKFAGVLATKPPIATRAILDAVNMGLNVSLDEALKYEAALFAVCRASEDSTEGLNAFLEKRTAQWKGK
ncbi:MAG: enoyl-CoA hydratase/isomerase family protein [bacterium JZ-2024 1]